MFSKQLDKLDKKIDSMDKKERKALAKKLERGGDALQDFLFGGVDYPERQTRHIPSAEWRKKQKKKGRNR